MVVILDAKCLYLGCKTGYFIFERREEWGQIFDVWSIHPILRAQLFELPKIMITVPLEKEFKAESITTINIKQLQLGLLRRPRESLLI